VLGGGNVLKVGMIFEGYIDDYQFNCLIICMNLATYFSLTAKTKQ
jgi:hypothetical protein